jgi:hypothetical protein
MRIEQGQATLPNLQITVGHFSFFPRCWPLLLRHQLTFVIKDDNLAHI